MDEPIAIIGLDARFPGEGDSAERFYESLLAGRSARSEVPPQRYNAAAFSHPDAERSGSTRAQTGHFLTGSVSAFDAPFFSITPTEARGMDPQQRGMLESVYKALENAGIPLSTAAGTQTGVYVGCFTSDYNDITVKDLDLPSKYAATGTVASMLSNRVSWFYDFRGPSITIDTACSSSLVAAHEACMSLKLREISMAIVGGCNLILTPEMTLKLGAAGVLGPDGKSYSFDHRANGYARGEGFGVLIFKRVSDAVRDGDVIRAVIRNSSTNQDGRSPGITQPTKAAQAQLIRHVYDRAGLDPSLTRFFEAHGTGTPVGDPIEASAISEIFTPHRSVDQPLYVGALKSNVGHLEGAAGVASLIKGVFTLERGIIPPNIWFEKPNPNIPDSWHLKFPTESTSWPQSGIRRMSVNSFGIGGSNAHVVMDDAFHFLQKYRLVGNHRTSLTPNISKSFKTPYLNGLSNGAKHSLENGLKTSHRQINAEPGQLFIISSADQEGVARMRDTYQKYISHKLANVEPNFLPDYFLRNLSHTLASKRTHHGWRTSIVARSLKALEEALNERSKPSRASSEPRLAFIFTGQGAQWPAMGMELMAYPAFQDSLLAADKYLNSLGCPWSLSYELSKEGGASRIDEPEYCQPICTALQVALVDLLTAWNIHPHALTGHSSGEIAAAYAVGAISQEAAWKIAYYRGKLSAELCNSESLVVTGMAAVGLDLDQTMTSIDRINQLGGAGSLEIACMNSWQSHTVSGDASKIDALVELLSSEKVFARKLNVKIAYHSRHMRAIASEYLESMGELEHGSRKTSFAPRFYSSVLGTSIEYSRLQDASYWVENLVSPVRFCESVTEMLQGSAYHPQLNGHELNGHQVNGHQVNGHKVNGHELNGHKVNGHKVNGHNNSLDPMSSSDITDVLEIGPHYALKGPFKNISEKVPKTGTVEYYSLLGRNCSSLDTVLNAAGSLFCRGHLVDLEQVNNSTRLYEKKPEMLIDLPSYRFNHSQEYWLESRRSRGFRSRPVGRHELLGARTLDWNKLNAVWRNYIRVSENPWIEDHKVSGDVLYPAAGMLVMAIEASRQLADPSKVLTGFRFKSVSFHLALQIPDDAQGIESQFCLRPCRETNPAKVSEWNEFELYTVEDDEWREHCRGLVKTEYRSEDTLASLEGSLEEEILQKRCTEEIKSTQSQCATNMPTEKLYRLLSESGLDFGPTFQTLSDVHLGPDLQITARVDSSVSRIRKLMPHEYIQPHLIHPATLDGIIHANLAPLVSDSKNSSQTRLPIFAKEMWVSAGSDALHDTYTVAAHAQLCGPLEAESSVTAVQSGTGRPSVFASGLVFRTVPNKTKELLAPSTAGAYNIDWKPDADLLSPDQLSHAFGIPMAAEEDPSDWMEDCEKLCSFYVRQFLGCKSDRVAGEMGWHHQRYLTWMERIARSSPGEVALNEIEELEARVTSRGTPEGKLIIAVGKALPGILDGQVDPLDVIFKDKIAENVYRHGLGSQRCYLQLCNYIDALAHKNPAMRILEIGAGTGGATRSIMQTLTCNGPRYQQYHFTDISPAFFEQAKDIFAGEATRMDFQVLNVEKDPLEQGFTAGTYDVVVAANVLHATKNINVSLSNARALLKPGGKLLLFEITNPAVLLSTFCFGVLPGWWLSEDADRTWGPLMAANSWNDHLIDSGFTGVDAIFHDFPDPAHQMSSIMVAAASVSSKVRSVLGPIYVLVDDGSSLQSDVSRRIAKLLHEDCKIITITNLGDEDLTNATCIVLVEVEVAVLNNPPERMFHLIQKIVGNCKKLLWLTRGGTAAAREPDMELVTGLARVTRSERPGFKFVTASFEQQDSSETIAGKCAAILHDMQDSSENEFRVTGGLVEIPRLLKASYLTEHIRAHTGPEDVVVKKLKDHAVRSVRLRIGVMGQLDTLRFEDDTISDTSLAADEVEFRTMACGLSPLDVASALSKAEQSPLGLEASGIVTRVGSNSKFQVGDPVFGLSFTGCIKTRARSLDGLLAHKPIELSWAEAASIPVAHTTAYATLHEICNIGDGDTVLIHSAAGSFGQAAIQVAQFLGAKVFVTVGSRQESQLLELSYGIRKDHILSKHHLPLKSSVKHVIGGLGVDAILDCSTDEAGESVDDWSDYVAPLGRVINLCFGSGEPKRQAFVTKTRQNIRFESYDLFSQAMHAPLRLQNTFQHMIDTILSYSVERTSMSPVTAYPFSGVLGAFREVQSGKSTARIVLEPHDDDLVTMVESQKPSSQFDSTASYVISGGLGGLGRSVARWMVSRGAKNLILLSRRGPVDKSAKELVRELATICDNVATPQCDLVDPHALKLVISECSTYMPPIKGCIHGSMVLKDNRFEDMSLEDWNTAVRSKVNTSWNLLEVLGRNLDFYVFLSSAVGITGNPNQSNYGAGNTFQDALAHNLASQGINVVSLDLPVIRGVGFVAEKPELMDYMRSTGWAIMEENEFHASLDYHCAQRAEPAPLVQSQVMPRFWLPQETAAEGFELPPWRKDPLFSSLFQTTTKSEKSKGQRVINHAALLTAATSRMEAEMIVLDALILKISRVLSVEVSNLDPKKALHSYGIDSLVAVELRSWLSKSLGATISIFDITNKSSIIQLAVTATKLSRFAPELKE
ncbi:hypothetical protein G7046_g192 [Stylonectria norvegica]|nr:hypothetical protein G7046_g192 [Stylonectria norvegica]